MSEEMNRAVDFPQGLSLEAITPQESSSVKNIRSQMNLIGLHGHLQINSGLDFIFLHIFNSQNKFHNFFEGTHTVILILGFQS